MITLHINAQYAVANGEVCTGYIEPHRFQPAWDFVRDVWKEADPSSPVWLAFAVYEAQDGPCAFHSDVINPGERTEVVKARLQDILERLLIKYGEIK